MIMKLEQNVSISALENKKMLAQDISFSQHISLKQRSFSFAQNPKV